MPLVHRLSGTGFVSAGDSGQKLRGGPPTFPQLRSPQGSAEPVEATQCPLCAARALVFDLSMRCCLDRYETLFGSVREHRNLLARARRSAQFGDLVPARRLVESYRRAFGPLAAMELKRTLWQSISTGQSRPLQPLVGAADKQPAS